MAMNAGDASAGSGMALAIFNRMDQLLGPKIPPDALEQARQGWRELAFAIASGVVDHLRSSLEIQSLQVGGSVTLSVASNQATGNITLTQTGATTGLVR